MNDGKIKASRVIKSLAIALILATLIITPFALGGCKVTIGYAGINVGNQLSATYEIFNGPQSSTIDVESGKTLVINYNSTVESGELTIKLYDTDHALIYDFPTGIAGTKLVTTTRHEYFLLEVVGSDAKGSFSLNWHTE